MSKVELDEYILISHADLTGRRTILNAIRIANLLSFGPWKLTKNSAILSLTRFTS